jgi:hypothetical protein
MSRGRANHFATEAVDLRADRGDIAPLDVNEDTASRIAVDEAGDLLLRIFRLLERFGEPIVLRVDQAR